MQVSKLPLVKTKFFLQIINMLLCNFCIIHGFNKCFPGGRGPWPSFHTISPACTASSSFNGLLWKHACIVSESSSTPSRTALPLPAAFLLTYFRRSLRWSQRSTETARHFNLHLNSLPVMQLTTLTIHSL